MTKYNHEVTHDASTIHALTVCRLVNFDRVQHKMVKIVNGSRYYRALESVSMLCQVLLPFTHARSESINADSLNFNFLQHGRRSGSRSQPTVYPRRLPVNTVIHTTLAGIELTTFRLLARRATSSATDSAFQFSKISMYSSDDVKRLQISRQVIAVPATATHRHTSRQ